MNRKKLEKMSDSEKLTLHLYYSCLMWFKTQAHYELLDRIGGPHPELVLLKNQRFSRSEQQILKRLRKLCSVMSPELRKTAEEQYASSFRKPEAACLKELCHGCD